jgi:hypothetical protein
MKSIIFGCLVLLAGCPQMEPLDGNRVISGFDAGLQPSSDAGFPADSGTAKPDSGAEDAGVNELDDHSDEREGATRLQPWQQIAGSLDGDGDVDWFTFTAGVGDLHRIETRGQVDTRCDLVDAQGEEIDSNDDDGEQFNCRIEAELIGGAEYFVRVQHFSAGGSGIYTLHVEIIAVQEIAPQISVEPDQANAGESFSFSGTGFSPQARVELQVASGGLQTEQHEAVADEEGNFMYVWQTRRDTRPGSFQVVALDQDSGLRSSSLEVTVLAAPEDDHSDGRQQATAIVFGRFTPGEIHQEADVDWFRFRSNRPGEWVLYTRGSLDTVCTLFLDADQIARDDDDGAGLNCRIAHELDAGRDYFIKVESYGTRIGDYELVVVPPPVPDDHGNDRVRATVMAESSSASGEIGAALDVDVFGFTAALTGDYILKTIGLTDTRCSLTDVQGRELQSDDNSGLLWNCQINARLDAGSTYYFHVRHSDDDGTGRYWLFLEAPQGTRSDDHGNSVEAATLVADQGLTSGNIEVGGDLDVFHFFATSGGARVIETSSDVDTVCRLLNAQGVEIAANDDAGEGHNCRISADLQAGLRYFVEVRLFVRSATGTYRLRLSAAE